MPRTPLLLALVVVFLACDRKDEAAPAQQETKVHPGGIDADTARKLADAAKALKGIGSQDRGAFAAAALAELEIGRLPRQLTEAMGELQNVPPELRSLIAMKALAEPPLLERLQEVCDGKAPEVLGKVAQVAPNEKIALVWDGCALERVGLVARAQAEHAGIGELLLACVAHHVLATKGGPSADETALLQAFVTGS